MPLVSVIMPSYNHEKYISTAIESVLNQTAGDLELIIIDDGSKDNSAEIIKHYKGKDNRVRAIFHNENKGISKTVNEAISEARGKFLAFLASDDVWMKDKLERQLEVLKKNENVAVWSDALIIDGDGNVTDKSWILKIAPRKRTNGNIFEELLLGNYMAMLTVIVKGENFKDIVFDEQLKYLNDYKVMIELAHRYEFFFIPEPLAGYRIHGKNTNADKSGFRRDELPLKKEFLQKYGNEISKGTKRELYFQIGILYSELGKMIRGLPYMYNAIKMNPLAKYNMTLLAEFITIRNRVIYKFSRSIHRMCRNII